MPALENLLAGVCLTLIQAAVLAQPEVQDVPDVKPDQPWIAVLFAVVLGIGAAVASVMTPKRTHQD